MKDKESGKVTPATVSTEAIENAYSWCLWFHFQVFVCGIAEDSGKTPMI